MLSEAIRPWGDVRVPIDYAQVDPERARSCHGYAGPRMYDAVRGVFDKEAAPNPPVSRLVRTLAVRRDIHSKGLQYVLLKTRPGIC